MKRETDTEQNTCAVSGRSLYLRMLRRLWIVPLAALVLAVLFGLVYHCALLLQPGRKLYRQTAKYYIHFAFNDKTQKTYDYYNAATWEDIVFSDPLIRDALAAKLPAGMTMDEAREDTQITLISDIRLMTAEVNAKSEEECAAVIGGLTDGLQTFAGAREEFDSIEFLSASEPEPVLYHDRTRNAVLLGAFLGLLFGFCLLWIAESGSGRVYVPEEAEDVLGLPVLGVFAGNRSRELPAFLAAQTKINLEKFAAASGEKPLLLVSASGRETAEGAAKLWKELQSGADRPALLPSGDPADPSFAEAAAQAMEALIVLPAGRENTARTLALVRQLRKMDVTPAGVLFVNADGKFLRYYYR